MVISIQDMTTTMDRMRDLLEPLKGMAMRSCVQQKHGACVFKGNRAMAFGLNKYMQLRSMDGYHKIPVTIHAEMDALSNIHSKYAKGMDMLIIRINRMGTLLYSRPCSSCIRKMQQKGIRRAYYSTHDGRIVWEDVMDMPLLQDSSANRNRRPQKKKVNV